jgi:Spy/CpxP family protein refolding chaperone
MKIRSKILTTLLCVVFIGNVAIAMPPADDLLAGPTMQDEEVTNEDMAASRQQTTGIKVNNRKRQHLWMQTLRSIQLTEDQEVVIQGLVKDHENLGREFRKTHGEELQKLRKEIQSARDEGKPVNKESRTRMNKLMESAPSTSIYQDKVWKVLTPDQQNNFTIDYQKRIELEITQRSKQDDKPRLQKNEMMQDRGFGPKDSKFRDTRIEPMDDHYVRPADALDKASLRRIKFLRRLQDLRKD